MTSGRDQLNRWLLTLLALVLLGAGGYGLARGYEAFGAAAAAEPILLESVREFVARNRNLFWACAFAVCLILALMALFWLRAQFRAPKLSELDLSDEESQGATRLRAAGASQALADDIESYLGVTSASARLLDDGDRPEVDLRVEVNDDADVAALRHKIDEHAIRRFCQALEVSDVEARLYLRLAGPAPRLVR